MSEIERRGQHAASLLQDPLMVEALTAIEQTLQESWIGATTTEVREELWYTLKGMQRFKQYLSLAVEQAEYETALMERTDGKAE